MIEGPYKLPKGWRWVRLGEVCTYERQTIDPRRYPHQEFLLFSIPAYDNNKQPEFCKGSEIGSSKLKIKPNICLFSKLNPRIPRAWVIKSDESITNLPMLASTEFLALRPHTHLIDLDYLGLCLLSKVFLSQFQVGVTGATSSRQRLKQEDVLNALIPLPPLDEQKRIVARVEELMSRIKEAKKLREETKKQTELLWQSVLAETFPQPGTQLPNGWRWVRLREITKDLESGKRPKGGVKNITNGIPSIGGEHITWDGGFDFSNIRYVPYEFYQSMRKGKINEGDILIVKDGATTGKTAYVSEDFPFKDACINEHVYILRVYENLAISRFVFLFLISSSGQNQIKNIFHGAAQGGINSEFINQVTIPLPPLEEQKRIANYLQEVHEKIKELKEVQTKTEEEIKLLEQSILEKAFRGEL